MISKAFRSSVKQLHNDFSGRPRRCLLLPLTRLPFSKALGRRSSCWWSRKPANRSRHRRIVVCTLSYPVMARVAAYDNGWSERWLFRKPTHRRRVDGAGCGAGHTLKTVASRYYTLTARPPEPLLRSFGLLTSSERSRWVGRRRRWLSGEKRSTLHRCGAGSRRSCRPPP